MFPEALSANEPKVEEGEIIRELVKRPFSSIEEFPFFHKTAGNELIDLVGQMTAFLHFASIGNLRKG